MFALGAAALVGTVSLSAALLVALAAGPAQTEAPHEKD